VTSETPTTDTDAVETTLARPETARPLWQRATVGVVRTRVGASFFRKVMHRIDRPLLRLTKGRVSFASSYPVLLLTTTGAKSGKQRTVPLLYVRRGDDVAIIGTRFGSTHHPGWYHNLRARPEATVEIRGRRQRCVAREANEDERAEIWQRAVDMYSGYGRYEPRARRRIPIMVLTPVA
jgi:deazaflavin-dependent oxidoreductase (nitroreductase family)